MITDTLKSFAKHCSNPRVIINKYTHERILVPCNHCSSCLNRISAEQTRLCECQKYLSKYCFFITLTYDERSVPRALIRPTSLLVNDDTISPNDYTLMPAYDIEKNEKDWHYTFKSTPDKLKVLFDKTNTFISKQILPCSIPILRYRDVQLFQKRLRKSLFNYLGTYEKIHSYIVGEYGPVHFRPHWHLLLFFDSKEVAEVVHKCVYQSWQFGRIDCQPAEKGASSYVSSYVNAAVTLPSLYQNCREIRPIRRHSRFFGQGIFFQNPPTNDGTGNTSQRIDFIEDLSDKLSNGIECTINGNIVRVYPWRSVVNRIFPRFGINVLRDAETLSSVIADVLSVPKILAKAGFVNCSSVMDMCRCLYKFIKDRLHEYTSSFYSDLYRLYGDKLDNICRCSRLSSHIDEPEDKSISALYRLMRPIFTLYNIQLLQSSDSQSYLTKVYKYVRNSVSYYVKRGMNSIRSQYEAMVDYMSSEYNDTSKSFFEYVYQLLDYNGYSYLNNPLLQVVQSEAVIRAQSLIKHKKLNDQNNLLLQTLNS
jgi:hypothetical protein